MAKRLSAIALAAVAALVLPAPAAALPFGVGWRCDANATVADRTLLATVEPGVSGGNGIVPRGADSVITRWEVDGVNELGPIAQRLEVYEAQGGSGQYAKVGASGMEMLGGLASSFDTRIPVDGGEFVGLWGPNGTLVCEREDGATSLRSDGVGAQGETKAFEAADGTGTPVVAWAEPDSDRDGYGDETQDRCPDERSFDSDCPIRVKVSRWVVRRHAIWIGVTPEAPARIGVSGIVGWQVPGGRGNHERGVAHLSGGTMRLCGGLRAHFRVPLPGRVLQQLERLRPRHSILAQLQIQVTDRHGFVSERERRVPLWGRKGLGRGDRDRR